MILRRLSIARLMLAVATAAVLLTIYGVVPGIIWPVREVALALGLGVGLGAGWFCGGRPVRAAISLVLLTLAVIGFLGWIVTVELAQALFVIVPPLLGLVVLVPCLACALTLGGSLGSIRAGWRRGLAVAVLVGSPLLMGSAMLIHWPFLVLFQLARPDLASMAERAAAGRAITFPVRAGVFTIEGVYLDPNHPGQVFLMTNTWPGKQAGFVRLADPMAPTGAARPSPSSMVDMPLGGGWAFDDWD